MLHHRISIRSTARAFARSSGRRAFALALLALPVVSLFAQDDGPPKSAPASDPRLAGFERYRQMQAQSPYANTRWQWIGPTTSGGRVTDVDVAKRASGARDVYVGTASGGLWKTTDEGATWKPVFEHQASATIGDVTVAPSNPDIVWVGTGEANIFRTGAAGTGVYKSTDAGATWQHMGLTRTYTIGRIIVHPTDPNTVWVAASGAEWTLNEDRGVYKTSDGGRTWQKVLYVNPRTGAVDLSIDPSDANTLYAVTWERIRWKWNDPENVPAYSGSGIWKSTNGGSTWTQINNGLPAAQYRGRIGIDVSRANPNIVYALVDNYSIYRQGRPGELDSYGNVRTGVIRAATIYRSDNKGQTWREMSDTSQFMVSAVNTFGWVFGNVRADPVDVDRVYFLGLGTNVSTDGGRTFNRVQGNAGGDNHALWIDPANPASMINGNDHAVSFTSDRGATWRSFRNQINAVQFFNVAYDMATPFRVYGSVQDEGSRRCTVDLSHGRDAIPVSQCEGAPGGEGSSHAIDWSNPRVVYSSSQYGALSRTTYMPADSAPPGAGGRGGGGRGSVGSPVNGLSCAPPPPAGRGGAGADSAAGRGRGAGADSAAGRGRGAGARGAGADTTGGRGAAGFGGRGRGSSDGLVAVGANIKPCEIANEPRQRGNWVAPTIVSPHDPNVIYHGFQHLYRSSNRGETWERISPDLSDNVPARIGRVPHQLIFTIAESPKRAGLIYVGTDDGNVHVTRDGGKSWTKLTSKLPQKLWVNKVVASAFDEGTVYVAQTGRYDDDFGVYLYKSTDYGQTFRSIGSNIPAGSVMALAEDPRDARILYAGTDQGVYVTTNSGAQWVALGSNLPSVGVYDLVVHPRDHVLVAATHGRGFWVFDVEGVK